MAVVCASPVSNQGQANGTQITERVFQELRKDNRQDDHHRGSLPPEHFSERSSMLNNLPLSSTSMPQFLPHFHNAVPSSLHHHPGQVQQMPVNGNLPTASSQNSFHPSQMSASMNGSNGNRSSAHGQNTFPPPQMSASMNGSNVHNRVFSYPYPMPPNMNFSPPGLDGLAMHEHFYMTNAHLDSIATTMHDRIINGDRQNMVKHEQHMMNHEQHMMKHEQLVVMLGQRFDDIKSHLNTVSEKADHTSNQTHNLSVKLDKLSESVKSDLAEPLRAHVKKSVDMQQSIKELKETMQSIKELPETMRKFQTSLDEQKTTTMRELQTSFDEQKVTTMRELQASFEQKMTSLAQYSNTQAGQSALPSPMNCSQPPLSGNNYLQRSRSVKEQSLYTGTNPYNNLAASYSNSNSGFSHGQGNSGASFNNNQNSTPMKNNHMEGFSPYGYGQKSPDRQYGFK
jgi:hypothetical protein